MYTQGHVLIAAVTSQLRVGPFMGILWESTASYSLDGLALGGLRSLLSSLDSITSHGLDGSELIPKRDPPLLALRTATRRRTRFALATHTNSIWRAELGNGKSAFESERSGVKVEM